MYLIHTETYELHEFVGDDIPPYVILSHTWGEGEVSLQEMLRHTGREKLGFQKITRCCQQAKNDGIAYAWIDTCCIDKKSSAELSEAINSMYEWYEKSQICYVYLSDAIAGLYKDDGDCSRWFTRGWTLQELLAPRHVEFYDQNWNDIGTRIGMASELSQITGINRPVLCGVNPRHCFVAARFSWAAGRKTTRPEDRAYSLLGLFQINMPLLYGEGHLAFQRLQKKIMKTTNDRTVLAWLGSNLEGEDGSLYIRGALAKSPDDFEGCRNVYVDRDSSVVYNWPPIITDATITLQLPSVELPYSDKATQTLVDIGCKRGLDSSLYLRLLGGIFRFGPLITLPDQAREEYEFVDKTIHLPRHSISGPNRIPLSFHFSPIQVCDLPAGSDIQVELRYFESIEEQENYGTPHGHAGVVLYSDHGTFNAATSSEFPAVHSLMIPQGKRDEVLLRPDSMGESIQDDTPKQRIAYTVCMLVLRLRTRDDDNRTDTLCRITLGALHEPVNRPWCIIDPPGNPSNGGSSDEDEELFRLRVKRWDAGDDTPDRCTFPILLPSGQFLKVDVTLKSRPSDSRTTKRGGAKEYLCYNVLISAILLDALGVKQMMDEDPDLLKHDYGFECFSDPEEQERVLQRNRGMVW